MPPDYENERMAHSQLALPGTGGGFKHRTMYLSYSSVLGTVVMYHIECAGASDAEWRTARRLCNTNAIPCPEEYVKMNIDTMSSLAKFTPSYKCLLYELIQIVTPENARQVTFCLLIIRSWPVIQRPRTLQPRNACRFSGS